MKTQIMMAMVMLLVCFVAGCSTTSDIKIRANPQSDYDEPFMEEIKELATKRKHIYLLGETIDQAEYDRRVTDIVNRRDLAYRTSQSEAQRDVVPFCIVRW